MLINALRWILHWCGQGLKLGLFYTVACFCVLPFYLPAALLEKAADHFGELSLVGRIGVVVGHIVAGALLLAVFTAILASQLKDWPLRPFVPKKGKSSHQG